MTFINPFREPGQWYRGNTHTHSTVSDGALSIEDRFAQFHNADYDFLVLTDHRRVSDVSACNVPGEFLAISGSELHPANPYGGDVYHIVAINMHEEIDTKGLHPNEVIARVQELGGEAILCHPYWCGHTIIDLMPLHGYLGVEVFNATCVGIGRGFSESHWDELLDKIGPTFGLAVDDCHGTEHDVHKGWVQVKSERLDTESILAALRRGSFYSSMGPQIEDLEITEESPANQEDGRPPKWRFRVRCSPAVSIVFKGRRSTGRNIRAAEGKTITEAEYVTRGSERSIRIEITDPTGRKAWTNPYWF